MRLEWLLEPVSRCDHSDSRMGRKVVCASLIKAAFDASVSYSHQFATPEQMMQILSETSVRVDECNSIFLDALTVYAHQGVSVEISQLVSCYAWDVMGAALVFNRMQL